MNRLPLVTVIVPYLNAGKFLSETIASVRAQRYAQWELLLIDDGSTDGSSEIGRRAAAESPDRVRYLTHPGCENRGVCASRNFGLREARGELIALLDADDQWLPMKLERQVALLAEFPAADMVFGAPLYWRSHAGEGRERRDHVVVPQGALNRIVEPPEMMLIAHPLGPGSAPCPSDLLGRRTLFERVGGFEESFVGNLQIYEDQAFLSKVYLASNVFVSDETWLKYRVHDDSCSAEAARAGAVDRARYFYLSWLYAYLERVGESRPAVHEALNRAMWPFRHPLRARLRRILAALLRRARFDALKRVLLG